MRTRTRNQKQKTKIAIKDNEKACKLDNLNYFHPVDLLWFPSETISTHTSFQLQIVERKKRKTHFP